MPRKLRADLETLRRRKRLAKVQADNAFQWFLFKAFFCLLLSFILSLSLLGAGSPRGNDSEVSRILSEYSLSHATPEACNPETRSPAMDIDCDRAADIVTDHLGLPE
jgi:hypothetical protein